MSTSIHLYWRAKKESDGGGDSVSQSVSRSGVVRVVVEISLARTRRGRFQGVITVCLGRALKKLREEEEKEKEERMEFQYGSFT